MTDEKATLGSALDFGPRFAAPLEAILARVAASWPIPGDGLRGSAVREVVERVAEIFATPLPDVLAQGWRTFDECRGFCDPALHPPGEVAALELAEHRVAWSCAPTVEVRADGPAGEGVPVAELAFRVEAEVGVHGGVLVIQDGRFIRLDTGELEVRGSLFVEGFIVASHETTVKVPGSLRFGEAGIAICLERPAAPVKVAVPAIVDESAARHTPALPH